MKVVNHRKNIVKAYHQEVHRLKQLKKTVPYDDYEWEYIKKSIEISESRIKLLKELQEPLKDYYGH